VQFFYIVKLHSLTKRIWGLSQLSAIKRGSAARDSAVKDAVGAK
jgi:hypothetical protein